MPQYRKQHVKTLDSIDIAEMPDDFTRLMWEYLRLKVDSEGRGIDDPQWLRSVLFPLRRDVTVEMVDMAMLWYANRCMIDRYEVSNRHYFCIVKWHEYQGETTREAPSTIPQKPVNKAKTRRKQVKANSREGHEQVTSGSRLDTSIDAVTNTRTDAEANTTRAQNTRVDDDPVHALVVKAQEKVGYAFTNWGKESKAAKTILRAGYCENDVIGCLGFLMTNTWYRDNAVPIDLMTVSTRIGAWVQSGRPEKFSPNGRTGPPGTSPEPKGFAGIRAAMKEQADG